MISSLYSGILGMKTHQTRMDVIGNNISNVNTTGYKASRANFQDVMYQSVKQGSLKTNPAQRGIGTTLASINTYMTPGALQPTGRTLDLGISGSGFFKVVDGEIEYYTREGVFYLTRSGDIVNSSGYTLVGETWNKAKSEIQIINPNNAFDTDNDGISDLSGGTLTIQGVLADGSPGEQTLINLPAGLSLDQVIDAVNVEQEKSGVKAYKYTDGTGTKLVLTTVFNGHDEKYLVGGDAALIIQNNTTGLGFDPTEGYLGEKKPTEIIIDEKSIPVADLNIQSDGVITGTDTDNVPLRFADGTDAARILLYTFKNQDGLERYKNNLFKASASSGTGVDGIPGSNGYGTIESGYLEMSNVELTDEFSNMITTQRGYQANSRIITVSDTMLEELLNLKR